MSQAAPDERTQAELDYIAESCAVLPGLLADAVSAAIARDDPGAGYHLARTEAATLRSARQIVQQCISDPAYAAGVAAHQAENHRIEDAHKARWRA